MFNLFALLNDDAHTLDNDALIRDLTALLPGIEKYEVVKQRLVFPKVEQVRLKTEDWHARLEIRQDEDMTLSLPILKKVLGKKTQLPDDFLDYNTELVLGFDDDPDKKYTNDIIFIGEFVRENYPGVVIYDQYNEDVW